MKQRRSAAIVVRGRVASGRGTAAPELQALREELDAIVREPLFPGSVNLVLERPMRLRSRYAATFDHGRRMVWPATLNGIAVWIYRWRSCPLHVIEVLAPVGLRTHLRLRNGDAVTLAVNPSLVGKVRAIEHLLWAALWLGRRGWTYSVGAYFQRVENWGMHLGAAQQRPRLEPTRLIARLVKK